MPCVNCLQVEAEEQNSLSAAMENEILEGWNKSLL